MEQESILQNIKEALRQGRLFVRDAQTGYHRSIYARCPKDGQDSPTYRVDRSGEAISRVVFSCPICAEQFDAAPEAMFLR